MHSLPPCPVYVTCCHAATSQSSTGCPLTGEPSLSPWSSPVFPVHKKDGTVRVCIDFRRLNAITVPDPYLMPRIDVDCLGRANSMTKIDLVKGFHQVPVRVVDRQKTTFCTPWEKYQYRYMPFRLRNSPATFQHLMDVILNNVLMFTRAYINDIVIFSTCFDI